jgi:cleavage and polyadenylation specificity factor subunit 1
MKERYFVPNFDYLYPTVTDCTLPKPSLKPLPRPNYDLNEVLMVVMGSGNVKNLYLMVTTDQNEYIVYQALPFVDSSIMNADEEDLGERLGLRFLRLEKKELLRDARTYASDDEDKLRPLDQKPPPTFLKKHKLTPFDGIGSQGVGMYAGVFVSGKTPMWLVVSEGGGPGPKLEIVDSRDGLAERMLLPSLETTGRARVRQHPMTCDGQITAFAPLHNPLLPNGFVYTTSSGHLRLCQLPSQFNLDHDWPVCKVPLGKTPTAVTYHYSSQTYILSTSLPKPFVFSKVQYDSTVAAGVIQEGDELPEQEGRHYGIKDSQRDEGMYWPETQSYKVELVSPVTWETVDR